MLFAPKEKGQGLVEYALILVLVAVVVIAVLLILGPIIGNVFTKINSSLIHQSDKFLGKVGLWYAESHFFVKIEHQNCKVPVMTFTYPCEEKDL